MCDFFFISTSQVQGKHGLDGDLVAKSSIFAGGGGDLRGGQVSRWEQETTG